MNGSALLDTNIVIALFAGEEAIRKLTTINEVFVPAIVIGELYFGAQKSSRSSENIARIEEFTLNCAVLPCDTSTAKHYSLIKHKLKERGRPIPENDIWIAAVAIQYKLPLISRDQHFQNVEGLLLEQW